MAVKVIEMQDGIIIDGFCCAFGIAITRNNVIRNVIGDFK